MKSWLMFKHIARTPAILIMLSVTFICVLLCGMLMQDDGIPSCGIVCGNDPLAVSIADELANDGLVLCNTKAELKKELTRGSISMGVVMPDDLTEKLVNGDTDGMIEFIETPVTFLPSLYRYRIAAYIIEAFTPYLTSEILGDMGFDISPEEMQASIDEYLANETEFAFTIENASGASIEVEHYAKKLSIGTLALFLFFAFGLFAVPCSEKQFSSIARRIGLKNAFLSFVIPCVVIVLLLFTAVSSLALILSDKLFASGTSELVISTIIYTVFLSALGILCTAVFRSTERIRVPMIAICMLSLGFCPIFADLPALIGAPSWFGCLLPPMFIYAAIDSPIICAVIAFAIFVFATLALYLSYKKRFNLK